jgi:hypothetical protein
MIRKSFVVIIAVALMSPAAFAQTLPPVAKQVVIRGSVYDDTYPAKLLIANVRVRLWIWDVIETFIMTPNPVVQVVLLDSTTTGALGTFAFKPVTAGPYSGGTYHISFDNPSYVSRQISVYAQADTSLTVLLLAAGAKARVAGTVWTACSSGYLGVPCILRPIPGCTVTVSTSNALSTSPVFLNPVIAITDSQGNYAIDSIPLEVNGERVSVSVAAAGYTSQTVDTTIRNNITTTVNFSLAKAARDTVYVTPQHPTTSDSLHFTLYNANHCCATIYRGNSVSASDTIIYLSYSYDDTLCPYVDCFAAGSETSFSSKPLAVGTYAIYKVESYYCPPGRACPLFLLAPERVGSVTVSPAASVRSAFRGTAPATALDIAGQGVLVTLAAPGRAILRVYDVSGRLVTELYNGRMAAGVHRFAIGSLRPAAGTFIVKLEVDGKMSLVKTAALAR